MTSPTCGRPHYATPPQLSAETAGHEVPTDCDDEVQDLWLQDARILELDLDQPEFLDVRLVGCDVSGVMAPGFIARRVELTETRLRGVTLAKGQYDDGLVVGCSTSELSFRFSGIRRVVFRDCDLSGADFTNATFDHVTFDGCDLQRARFDGAIVKCLSVTNCNLVAIQGVSGLKGAQLDASDLPGLAIALALDAGIKVRDA